MIQEDLLDGPQSLGEIERGGIVHFVVAAQERAHRTAACCPANLNLRLADEPNLGDVGHRESSQLACRTTRVSPSSFTRRMSQTYWSPPRVTCQRSSFVRPERLDEPEAQRHCGEKRAYHGGLPRHGPHGEWGGAESRGPEAII